jgi:hypothetical protein
MKKRKYKKIILELTTENEKMMVIARRINEQNTALEDRIMCLLVMESQDVLSAIIEAEAEE